MAQTNLNQFLDQFNAGILKDKLSSLLSTAAASQVQFGSNGKKAKVGVEFTFQQIGESDQVAIQGKISVSLPKAHGKMTEDDVTETPYFYSKEEGLTINPPRVNDKGQFSLVRENDGFKEAK